MLWDKNPQILLHSLTSPPQSRWIHYIIQSSDKYLNKERNKNILQTILRKIGKNDEVYKFLNMSYKDMFLRYYLKSNKKTFKGEKEDEFYETHLEKLKNLYGNNYIDSYKRNAEYLIKFFYTC